MFSTLCVSRRKAVSLFACTALSLLFPLHTSAQGNTQEGNGAFATRVREHRPPHLTVVISIDQFRADYLRRLNDLFLPPSSGGKVGGFRYLMTAGSYFIDAHYGHFPTYTGPGHSIILTGSYPYKNGIISNDWWNPATLTPIYCVDDPRWKVVGAAEGSKAKPMGPLNLRSTTVGDELKLASGGASKVITISLKDRAAILLGGHAQDMSLWFDDAGGRWISSTAFCKDGKLPAWADAINSEAIPDKTLGTTWTPSLPADVVSKRSTVPNLPPTREPYGMGLRFPHTIGKDKIAKNYRAFTLTPAANAYVFTTAKRAVTAEKLGQRGDTPDLLALNLATNDYVGHAFGPYSPEALEITVQTDHLLSDFLNFLQTTVPGGLREVVFVITADHGVVPIPEEAAALDINAGRVLESQIDEAAQKALSEAFGGGDWVGKDASGKTVGGYFEPYIYLNPAAITQALSSGKATSRAQIEETAARAVAALPGLYACYTRSQLLGGQVPATDIVKHLVNGFHPKLSGDIVVVPEPNYLTDNGSPGPYATSHGLPYAYDTHVPILIAGPGIRPGVWADPVSPADIAPTLCALLGIELPSGCDGVILRSALK